MSDLQQSSRADALLGEIKRERGGQLKVFLGAAPGVGKTFAMLNAARELGRQRRDVVVGIAETHGRVETQALLEGLEVLPRKRIEHRGHTIEELDIDALLARRPAIALIDELAHRNAPGSRHERRYQDVDELLDAGIDVYTTVNIQHLESLNDVVFQITGVRVSETVPDAFFDRLRDVVLIDLPPRELIERLKDGKVYVPEQAAQALQAFFSPTNLTALRELAMQTIADRVDTDLRKIRRTGGGTSVPVRRRVLVAIDGRGHSEYLVRAARRTAQLRQAPWTVVYVERSGAEETERRSEVDEALALARRLGGEAEVLHGNDIVGEIIAYADRNSVSSIVVGRTRERPFARMFNRTLTQRLLQQGAHFELTIVNTSLARAKSGRVRRAAHFASWREYGLVALGAITATVLAFVAERYLGLTDLAMIFLVAVIAVAAHTSMTAAVATATLCFLSYNFFFIEPRFTLYISARHGVVTVLVFLAAALIGGRLATRLRGQVLALNAANLHATALQSLSRRLAAAADAGQVLAAGRDALAQSLDAIAHLFARAGDALELQPRPEGFGPTEHAAADWTFKHQRASGRFTDTLGSSRWWFLPLPGGRGAQGVTALRFDETVAGLTLEQRRLAEAMVSEIAEALARTHLVEDLESERIGGETERLRSALLSSVSHDLRSPLASIIGSASSLDNYAESMSAEDRHSLLETIRLEGERLDRYIQNLLDMTRLGHGGIALRRDWIGVDELIGSAVGRLQRYQPAQRFEVTTASELPPIWVHAALVEQALFNVIENAGQFSPPDAPVRVDARLVDNALRIEVSDRGPGIPDEERARIFDMFHSVERGDRDREGTGLGLTISRGMIGAHGGSVEAFPGSDGVGTLIRVTLPLMQPPPA